MKIEKLDPTTFSPAFNILCKSVLPAADRPAPFNALWNIIRPGGSTKLHRHHEDEAFFIVRGRGHVTANGVERELEIGDVIEVSPFTDHILANSSPEEDLLFLNIYWEDMKKLVDAERERRQADGRRKRVLVFGSPPNPNGDLHLGHLAGPYLSADLYVRHRRMLGDDAYYMIGTDDNQIWTVAMADKLGVPAQDLADRFAGEIEETLRRARVEIDGYYRPNHSPYHHDLVKSFVTKLHADGHLVAKDAPALVCTHCDRYLFEFYVTGKCPHCGKGSCGNACEECGLPNEVVDLVDPLCRLCGRSPEVRPVRRLFFPLEPHRESLEHYISTVAMTTQHRALCRRLLDGRLPDIVASHPIPWGIRNPVPGFESHCVSAWLEMAPGYVAASAELADHLGAKDGWSHFWRSSEAEVVQFFGYDNCWNHGLLYFAIFRAYDPAIEPPRGFVSNQLYRLDHSKFSTSRNHAVWARDLVNEHGADAARFYLAYTCPEAEQTNFSLAEFEGFVDQELHGRWRDWFQSAGKRLQERFGGIVPEAGTWTEEHRQFLVALQDLIDTARQAYRAQTFSPQRVARVACELVRIGHDFGKAESAWALFPGAKDERRTAMALELAALSTLALIAGPLMPDAMGRLWRALGYSSSLEHERWQDQPAFVPHSRPVGCFESIFGAASTAERAQTAA